MIVKDPNIRFIYIFYWYLKITWYTPTSVGIVFRTKKEICTMFT